MLQLIPFLTKNGIDQKSISLGVRWDVYFNIALTRLITSHSKYACNFQAELLVLYAF